MTKSYEVRMINKIDAPDCSLALTNRYTSAEIAALDKRMRAERGDTRPSFRD